MNKIKRNIMLYFILAFLISWILWLPSVLKSNGYQIANILLLFGQFAILGPMIAAVIVLAISNEKQGVKNLFKGAWNWKFKKIWLIPTLLLPAFFILITMTIKMSIEYSAFTFAQGLPPVIIFGIVLLFIGGPIEEFGWRGYALPQLLKKHSFLMASLILGLLHGLWHIPLHFIEGTVQSAMPLYEFVLVTMIGAVITLGFMSTPKVI